MVSTKCHCLSAGMLRERITIQRENATQDASGQEVPSWTDVVANVAAAVRFTAGREGFRNGQQVVALYTHRVTIRYRSDVSPQMRIKWGTRILNIESAGDPDGQRRELELLCVEDAG